MRQTSSSATKKMDPESFYSKFEEIDTQWEKFLKGGTITPDERQDYEDRSVSTHNTGKLVGESIFDEQENDYDNRETGSQYNNPVRRKITFEDERDITPTTYRSRSPISSVDRDAPPSPEISMRSSGRSPSPSTMVGSDAGADSIDMFRMFDIFKSCSKRNWHQFVQHIQAYPEATRVHVSLGSRGLQLAQKGNLLLHEVCRNDPSTEAIETLLATNRAAAREKGSKGYLPLHYACASGASAGVVSKLMKSYPEAVKVRDGNDLMLPLHLACKWGSSKEVFDLLIKEYPEGKSVRDIYAKSPLDYANNLGSQKDREIAISCLETKVLQESPQPVDQNTFTNRSSLFNDGDRPVRVELKVAKSKMQELSDEITQREHEFALMIGEEQKKANQLQRQREALLTDAQKAKATQDAQQKQLKVLSAECDMLKSLQETHEQKRKVLAQKVKVLEEALALKEDLIGRLEHENNYKYNKELRKTLQNQEAKFNKLLSAERERVAELERRGKEVEVTHRLYTEALMEEHDTEAQNFEELTLRFQKIEKDLREELKNVTSKKTSAEEEMVKMKADHEVSIKKEHEKVSFLEEHVSKVNSLLKSEQQRFQELEAILQEALALEQEQREEMAEEWNQKEQDYQMTLSNEQHKVQILESDYNEVRELLKAEHEKIGHLENYQSQLESQLLTEQLKLDILEETQKKNQELLEQERENKKKIQASESTARQQLSVEQEKVKYLEEAKGSIQKLLDAEKIRVAELSESLELRKSEYETEKRKVKALQKSQTRQRQVMESLQAKIAVLEEEALEKRSLTHVEGKQVEFMQSERDTLQGLLDAEKEKVQQMTRWSQELQETIKVEKEKVLALEQAQVIAEAEIHANESDDASAKTLEDKLIQSQMLLNVERGRLSELKGEHVALERQLENDASKLQTLADDLLLKDMLLAEEREKYEKLEKMYIDTKDLLEAEREKAESLRNDHQKIEKLLEFEKASDFDLENSAGQAKSLADQDSDEDTGDDAQIPRNVKIGEDIGSTGERDDDSRSRPTEASVYDMESNMTEQDILLQARHERLTEMEERLKEQEAELELERDNLFDLQNQETAQELELEKARTELLELRRRVLSQESELEEERASANVRDLELSSTKSLYNAEKRKVKELEEEQSKVTAELKTLKARLNDAEQSEARRRVLLESEQNKVKAAEHARDQLEILMDWEKQNTLSQVEEMEKVKEKLREAETDISSSQNALEEEKRASDLRRAKLESLADMKREVVRLSAEARHRDILIGSVLNAIDEQKALANDKSVKKAREHVSDLHRIIGLDLAGFNEGAITVGRDGAGALVSSSRREVSTLRRVGSTLCWTVPLIPLVAYHHDPEMVHNLVGQIDAPAFLRQLEAPALLRQLDASALQEPIIQMLGMASALGRRRS